MEVEALQNQHLINQILSVSQLGTRLTKQQISQIDLQQCMRQCNEMLSRGSTIRECSNYLHGMAMVCLKQYSILRQDIQQLQHSMMSKSNFIEEESNTNPAKSTRSKRVARDHHHQQSKSTLFELQELSEGSIDNPRNIASNERLQLEESQRTPIDMNSLFRRDDQSNNKIIEESNMMHDLQSVEGQSLKEVVQNRKTKSRDQQSDTSKSTPVPRIVVQNENGDIEEIIDHQFNTDSKNQLDELRSVEDLDQPTLKQKQILETLENFGIHLMSRDEQVTETAEGQKSKKQQQKRTKNAVLIDEKDKDPTNEEYRQNLEQFMKYQEKVEELQWKLNVFNKQAEFWKQNDDLMNLIEEFDLPPLQNTTVIAKRQLNSNSKMQGMTTFDISNYQQQQEDRMVEEFELPSFAADFDKNVRNSLGNEQHQYYDSIFLKIKQETNHGNQMSDNEYFDLRGQQGVQKGKAFYDLLIMSRLGILQIQDRKEIAQKGYSKLEINL